MNSAFADNDPKVALATLKTKALAFGEAKIEGIEELEGKKVPVLFFGKTKINNSFVVVDEVKKAHGGTATLFVKDGEEFVRVSTNVLKSDGARAIGTRLSRNEAYEAVIKGTTFCGQVSIMGSPYNTCYEPIKDNAGKILGIYYVGYKK
jgi:hypothetical protein